jgi:outer membrane receptor protein involved in Fe transport
MLPAGTLADMLRQIAARTGSEIISLEPGLAREHVSTQRLSGDTGQILDRLVQGTAYRVERIGANSFRIERRPALREVRRASRPPDAVARATDIIVTASKFPVPLLHYPGSVVQAVAVNDNFPVTRSDTLDDMASRLPALQRTELGEGRNKIFIRGIADSSFNGATQPTASIYFGDALLGFGSPSPNLKLYDIATVEVLEGPQGTLYGSGSLGGVIHIVPNPVDLNRMTGSAALGASATVNSQPGWDASGMVNMPLIDSRVGVRLLGYHDREGGYINSVAGGRDSNSVTVSGGRMMLAARIGETTRLDGGVLYQATRANDASYVRTGNAILTRNMRIREPYSSNLLLGHVVLEKKWDSGTKLTSVTSMGSRSSSDTFDSTPGPTAAPVAYQLGRASNMFAHETRLSRRSDGNVSWVIGVTYQHVRDGQTRALGKPDEPSELDEVTNITYSASAFGQATVVLGTALNATVGIRWTAARTDSEPSRDSSPLIRGVEARRLDPTVALSWRIAPQTMLYTRIQTGYRNGGMAVARGVGRVANFESDSVIMGEIGARHLRSGPLGLSLSTALSYTAWDDIQADLVTRRGLPYTANIGDARVLAVEATYDWVPLPGLMLGGSAFYTDSHISGSLANQSAPRDRRLPDTPIWSGTAHAGYGWGDKERMRYRIGGTARYAGRSILGPGTLLNLSQGDYTVVDLHGGVHRGMVDVSLTIENLLNTRANRFAFGNPITFAVRDQSVPLRPMTFRAAIGVSW